MPGLTGDLFFHVNKIFRHISPQKNVLYNRWGIFSVCDTGAFPEKRELHIMIKEQYAEMLRDISETHKSGGEIVFN